ncbi:Ankyrin repeat and KH domain-containing protein mask [Gryllus bimaculatus]|nr:Ankyrin repeat and KH domain-containing protein mask [Gryllus bimaculatus]
MEVNESEKRHLEGHTTAVDERFTKIELGRTAIVTCLLEKGADVNAAGRDGETPLLSATKQGNAELVPCLVERGANVNTSDVNGETPLLVAVENQKNDFVQLLLTKGASPTRKNNVDESPLFVASKDSHVDILELLLEAVQESDRDEIGRSLRMAASAEVVWMLVDAARDVVLGEAGREALVASAADGRQEALHAILQLGVSANVTDLFVNTALLKAASKGHPSCVRTLLEAGAQVNVKNKDDQTALHLAAREGERECVVALLEAGAQVNVKDKSDQTPLHEAAGNGNKECVVTLLDAGAQINRDEIGRSLRVAASAEVVWVLADAARDVVLGEAEMEALVASAADGRQETLQALLQLGVNANATEVNGRTSLHNAASEGHTLNVRTLLEAGVQLNIQYQ